MRKAVKPRQRVRYPVLLQEFSEAGKTVYIAEIPDLPGCMSHGRTPAEAIKNVEEARQLWIKARREEGLPIPPPTEMVDFSGKFLLRTPKSLHRNLTHRAAENGVSLNQYAVAQLAEASAVDAVRQDMRKLFELIDTKVEGLAQEFQLFQENLAGSLAQLSLFEGTVSFKAANVVVHRQGIGQGSTRVSNPRQIQFALANTAIPASFPTPPAGVEQPAFVVVPGQLRKPAAPRK